MKAEPPRQNGLLSLRVRNYALIEDLTVELSPGLNVLSGETGAGKSIIVGALSLLLGDKPDADMIRTGADSAQVEGRFEIGPRTAAECDALGIPLDAGAPPELALRRRTERTGRGGAWANDSSLTVASLQKLGDRLVDLHGQHQHQLLLKPDVHLDILDEYAGLGPERTEFAERFRAFEAQTIELARLDRELAERRARRELTEFQARELTDAGVKPGEREELDRERELLQTSERRFTLARQIEELLSEQEGSISALLAAAGKTLAELAVLDPALAERRTALTEAGAVADDLWRELVRYREDIEFSPERLDQINSRLFLIEKLERKYGIGAGELPGLEAKLRGDFESLEVDATRRDELSARLDGLRRALVAGAESLSRRRSRARTELEKKLKAEFEALGLGKAAIEASIARLEDPEGLFEHGGKRYRMTATGVDCVELLFSANPGEELRPLRKVASGGELSRIMLGLKCVLTGADPVPTLVFDEIDVGIGGKVAEAVGRKLRDLARTHQVVCITHLAQIARHADRHFLVAKTTRAGRTRTTLEFLDDGRRVEELARMAGGATVTKASLALAREMLESAGDTRD